MTNEKQEQTQSRGRLLVIDDNPHYVLTAVRAARTRGYEVDVAFDLKGAMNYLQSGSYNGIITDLQFYEEGIDGNTSNVGGTCKDANDLEGIVKAPWEWGKDEFGKEIPVPIFQKGTEVYEGLIETLGRTDIKVKEEEFQPGEHFFSLSPKANPELRAKIASELATQEYASQLNILGLASRRMKDMFWGDSSPEKLQRDLMSHPAIGYEVIKYAQEHNIPFAVVSSVGHGQHCIPALLKTELATPRSLMRHEAVRYAERDRIDKEKAEVSNGLWEKAKQGIITKEEKEVRKEECTATFNPKLERLNALVLDKAILVMQEGKEQHTYDFAIDMIEGRINETRPYRVE